MLQHHNVWHDASMICYAAFRCKFTEPSFPLSTLPTLSLSSTLRRNGNPPVHLHKRNVSIFMKLKMKMIFPASLALPSGSLSALLRRCLSVLYDMAEAPTGSAFFKDPGASCSGVSLLIIYRKLSKCFAYHKKDFYAFPV